MKNPLRRPLDRIRRLRREAGLRRDLEDVAPEGAVCSNIRDVAGLPTVDGRRTRPGILLRGDAPFADDGPGSPGWPDGVAWPPGVAIDLRGTRELDDPYPLADTRWVHLPLFDALAPDHLDERQRGELTTARLYLAALDRAATTTWLPPLIEAAVDGPHPVLVHCAAGKDRTGVTVAVLLRLAGVTRAAVEADFVRTNARRIGLQQRLERRGALRPGVVAPGEVGVIGGEIVPVLDRLDGDGAVRLAEEAGITPGQIARWRGTLLA